MEVPQLAGEVRGLGGRQAVLHEPRPHCFPVAGDGQIMRNGVVAELDQTLVEAAIHPGAAGTQLDVADVTP